MHRLDPADDEVDLAAETFRMLADPTRLRLALRLLQGEQSGNDLARAIGRPASGVSQHLAKLRLARLVDTRREGTTIHYRFTKPESVDRVGVSLGVGMKKVPSVLGESGLLRS